MAERRIGRGVVHAHHVHHVQYVMRDSNTTIYRKTIAISQDDIDFISKIKGKKSKAGILSEVIKFYKDNKYAEK